MKERKSWIQTHNHRVVRLHDMVIPPLAIGIVVGVDDDKDDDNDDVVRIVVVVTGGEVM